MHRTALTSRLVALLGQLEALVAQRADVHFEHEDGTNPLI